MEITQNTLNKIKIYNQNIYYSWFVSDVGQEFLEESANTRAILYEVNTKRINEVVKNNLDKLEQELI